MIEDMQVRHFAPKTQSSYVQREVGHHGFGHAITLATKLAVRCQKLGRQRGSAAGGFEDGVHAEPAATSLRTPVGDPPASPTDFAENPGGQGRWSLTYGGAGWNAECRTADPADNNPLFFAQSGATPALMKAGGRSNSMKAALFGAILWITVQESAAYGAWPPIGRGQKERPFDFRETHVLPVLWTGDFGQKHYKTYVVLTNPGYAPVTVSLQFFCEHGKEIRLPLNGQMDTSFTVNLGPHEVFTGVSDRKDAGNGESELAWILVRSTGSVKAETTVWSDKSFSINQIQPDERDAVLRYVSGGDMVVVNPLPVSQTVQLIVRDSNGDMACRAAREIQAGAMLISAVAKAAGCDPDSGSLEVIAPDGIAAIVLRYPDDGSIAVSYPAHSEPGANRSWDEALHDIWQVIVGQSNGNKKE